MPKIKLVIFDLDGVLIDSKEIHYIALNRALEEVGKEYIISKDEHLAKYDGHPTTYKLNLLTKEKGLSQQLYDQIWRRKQDLTQDVILDEFKPDERIISILKELKNRGYKIYCASNSIWITVKNALLTKGFLPYIDWFISNEEIRQGKPSPDIYFRCFERSLLTPLETLICEDSPVGRAAAYSSGGNVCPIEDVKDLTLDKIIKYISKYDNNHKYNKVLMEHNDKLINIVIPMAGGGTRFQQANYTFPKPLIEVNGKPMVQLVVDNIAIKGRYIFIVQKDHYEKYNLKYLLNLIAPNCEIIQVDGITEGACASVLLAKDLINNDEPLIIANSDQFLEWNPHEFLYVCLSNGIDGAISVFESTHPKFSYAKVDKSGYVEEVAEKKVISNTATTGVYMFRRGSDFVESAEQMIAKNIRTNNEFYLAPCYNEAVLNGLKIKTVECKKMWCVGDPESLNNFLKHYSP
jgi:beta-phosphoglucomutase-like phosphatase (HAD superfamily)/dTDP-glucose pyrophosphorylase